jgi:hypothetical protein
MSPSKSEAINARRLRLSSPKVDEVASLTVAPFVSFTLPTLSTMTNTLASNREDSRSPSHTASPPLAVRPLMVKAPEGSALSATAPMGPVSAVAYSLMGLS